MSTARLQVPGRAVTRIQPSRGWWDFGFKDLWSFRELLYFLVWRDVKVRYRQTAFGALWAIIQPLLLMGIFTLFLGRLSGIAPAGVPYPLFALSGLVAWNLFSRSVGAAAGSLVGGANLLQKAYFPRLLLPVGTVASMLIDFGISLVVLIGVALALEWLPGTEILLLVPLSIVLVGVSGAIGVWLSAINVRYRDVGHAVPFLLQLWLFASPVAYSRDLLPAGLRDVFLLNPMVGIIEGFRWAVLRSPTEFPASPFLAAVAVTAVLLVTGLAYFARVSRSFADIV